MPLPILGLGALLLRLVSSLRLFAAGGFIASLLLALTDWGRSMIAWIITQIGSFGLSAIQALGIGDKSWTIQGFVDAIPIEVRGIMSAVGVGDVLIMISSAYLIRFSMKLIPFLRT